MPLSSFGARRRTLLATALAAPVVAVATPVFAKDAVWTNVWGLAIRGYDPVAYFKEGRPVEGSGDFETVWNGATWRFASQENLDDFTADPEAFAPQYGGYCAWAVAQGYTASVVPEAWDIVDGKLYLNFSLDVQNTWRSDIPGFIASADSNWPGVIQ